MSSTAANSVDIKVKFSRKGKVLCRVFEITKEAKFGNFLKLLKIRYRIGAYEEVELFHHDEENELVIISSDSELSRVLRNSEPNQKIKFELQLIESNLKAKIRYPDSLIGEVDDIIEVTFESKYLVSKSKKKGDIWGTKVYTDDSDLLRALFHRYSIKTSNDPPPYDIITKVKILPGQMFYRASENNGIMSGEYGPWDANSFEFRNIRYEQLHQFGGESGDDDELINELTKKLKE
ncbi:hypothetical protein C1645_879415 [Glomus cerebriforme]|uniref:PB1 domain-containing protein n=1 Tax=Glomus cerebriforme TaxID=658196 RepID=A0A397SME2_9GLOM|nr:hypothetical protein C1645_879415 [Glomus cerebriforme]